jgi:hypothetical protein
MNQLTPEAQAFLDAHPEYASYIDTMVAAANQPGYTPTSAYQTAVDWNNLQAPVTAPTGTFAPVPVSPVAPPPVRPVATTPIAPIMPVQQAPRAPIGPLANPALGSLIQPPPNVTQEQLTEFATRALGPRVRELLQDRPISPTNFGVLPAGAPGTAISNNPMSMPASYRAITARQLGQLDPSEQANMNTYLVNKFNLDTPTVADQAKKQSGVGTFTSPTRLLGYGI